MRSALFLMNGRTIPVGLTLLIIALALLTALAIANTAPPNIETEFGGATVQIVADQAWTLWPQDCVTIAWELESILSVYIDGQGAIGWGELNYCPWEDNSSPVFDISSEDAETRAFELNIRYFPAALTQSLAILVILCPFLIAAYYLATLRMTEPIPLNLNPILVLAALLCFLLLLQTANAYTTESLFSSMGNIFVTRAWQTFGLVLAGLVFIPLVFVKLQHGLQKRAYSDFLAIGAFFFFVLLLFLPFGFDSIGQYEEWVKMALLEGRPSRMSRETLMRIFTLIEFHLAQAFDSEAFSGLHLLNFLLFWGNMSLFYGILRRLKLHPFSAFLAATLFMIYPVNSLLMSLRSMGLTMSTFALLAAIFLTIDHMAQSSRLKLLGIWLALFLTLGKHEIAFAIILVVPLLWLLSKPRKTWRNFNMTVIWYLVPVLKVVYLLILASAGLRFYGIQYVKGAVSVDGTILDTALHYANVIADVYRQTFWHGWREALSVMGANKYFLHILISVSLIAVVMALLAIDKRANALPSRKEAVYWLLGGLLLILPAIGIGMWIDKYLNEMWRLYVLVPFGASIALSGFLLLLTAPIKKPLLRKAAIIIMSLLLVLPGLARLYVQHAHFVDSANAKAKILLQIVEQAPRYDSNARLALVTDMSLAELSELGIDELWTHMFDSAIYLLYGEDHPKFSSLCILGEACSTNDIDKTLRHLDENTNYSEIVIFQLQDDLSVELLYELPPELGGASNATYNPTRLIDTSAPLPPRALTMLAAARRD